MDVGPFCSQQHVKATSGKYSALLHFLPGSSPLLAHFWWLPELQVPASFAAVFSWTCIRKRASMSLGQYREEQKRRSRSDALKIFLSFSWYQ